MIKLSLIAIGLALTGCTSSQPALQTDCSFLGMEDTPDKLICGKLIVPETYGSSNSVNIEIAYVIHRSKETTDKYPVIILHGGPGAGLLQKIQSWEQNPLLQGRDLILVDQRGVGHSSPLPKMNDAFYSAIAGDYTLEQESEYLLTKAAEAYRQSEVDNIDFSQYQVFNNAEDIISLMQNLPYDGYHLFGMSYGTKLGQIIMSDPRSVDLVKSSAMYGIVSTDNDFFSNMLSHFGRAFEQFVVDCSENQSCTETVSDPVQSLQASLQDLTTDPLEITFNGALFTINVQDAIYILRYFFYRGDVMTTVPQYLNALASRDIDELERLCQRPLSILNIGSVTAYVVSMAYDDFHDQSVDNFQNSKKEFPWLGEAGIAFFESVFAVIDSWALPQANASIKQLPPHQIPTLILTNAHDPTTPPENLRAYQRVFEQHETTVYDEYGHITMTNAKWELVGKYFEEHK